MDKTALKVDYGTVGRFAAGGAMAGAGTAALLNLVHMLREQRKEQQDKLNPETDSNTIVLNLPPKMGTYTTKMAFRLSEESTESSEVMHDHTKPGFRHSRGKRIGGRFTNPMSKKDKVEQSIGQDHTETSATVNKDVAEPEVKEATGWPTLTLSALAAMGGGAGGVALVDKLYAMRREKQLKDELAAAQNDYVTALSGPSKIAAALDNMFPMELEKDADTGNRTFGILNYPLAAAAILTLMGTGGTAYITKKVLDEKLRESQEKGMDLPKVKRIVFRSTPGAAPTDMQKMSEEDITSIKAALFIMMDKLDSTTKVLGTPGVKEAQQAAGLSTNKLFNLSQGDIGGIMDALNNNPNLAKIIMRAGMAKRPIMKHFQWMADTAPGLALGKNRIRSFLNDHLAAPKTANALDTAAAMLVGKALGSGSAEDATKALLEKGVAAVEPKVETNDTGKPLTDLSKVTVSGQDPQAEAYVKANKIKIMKLLQTMADEGKI